MRLAHDLWIVGGYYIDFDMLDELRIIGPNNHLYCGLIDIPRHKIIIKKIISKKQGYAVEISGVFLSKNINLYSPAMEDIREMRELIGRSHQEKPFVSFLEVRSQYSDKMVPHYIEHKKIKGKNHINYKRFYGEQKNYQITLIFPQKTKVDEVKHPYRGHTITGKHKDIPFTLLAETNDCSVKQNIPKMFVIKKPPTKIFKKLDKKNEDGSMINYFWKRTEAEIKHLVEWGKTSGDSFGTIFPRDWMESADLGVHDLSPHARDYMYFASLKNVTRTGESWHEDVVGEYRYQHELAGKDIFDRNMIDIEPRHIIGLKLLTKKYLKNPETKQKTRSIANYILSKARENSLIIFKKDAETGKFYSHGNWRDSEYAYKKISETIAPFDVNCVFYPEALRVIGLFQKELGLKTADIRALIKKWERVKDWYAFKNPDGTRAYALALYDIKEKNEKTDFKQFKVNHLDESYLLTYHDCAIEDVMSFCKRLVDEKYFFTHSGPTIVAKNNHFGYTTLDYHGVVIWTKQVAFAVLGLSKHLKIGIEQGWDKKILAEIKQAILKTCEAIISAFVKLEAIPELHYDKDGEPKFYTEQKFSGSQMSKVQLWSAVGARRILRKYSELITSPKYKKI